MNEKLTKYPSTNKFKVIDTIGVPHPYCITPKHLEYSHTMDLDIEGAEKRSREAHPNDPRQWAVCDICEGIQRRTGKAILPFSEHKRALLIEVKDKRDLKDIPELKDFLLSIKTMAEQDGFAGFAFKQLKP